MITVTNAQMDSIMEFFAEEYKRKQAEAEARKKHKVLYFFKDLLEKVQEAWR